MGAYRDLVRSPGVLSVTVSQLFARLPLGMLSLGILLHVQARSGSFAQAGAVVACVSVGQGVAMPMTSRLVGRVGRSVTLSVAAVVNATAMVALALIEAPPGVLMVLGAIVGASVPPLMPVVRSLYPHMVSQGGVRALFALDTTAQELIWVIGPVAATVLASTWSTTIPLILSAGVTVAGTLWFLVSAHHVRSPNTQRPAGFGAVLLNRPMALAVVASAALVASFMAFEVGIVAYYGQDGMLAGAAIALASVGSLIGGLGFGHRKLGLSGLVSALTVVAVGTALFGVVGGLPLQFAALFVSGLGFAPALSALYLMVSQTTPQYATTEAFGWLTTAALVGGALGTALAGVATDLHGHSGAITVALILSVIAALSPLALRIGGPIPGLSGELPQEVR